MKQGLKYRTTRISLVLVPIILAVVLRMYYVSTPQQVAKRFLEAVRSGDSETAINLCTPDYKRHGVKFSDWQQCTGELPSTYNVVWKRFDSERFHITYHLRQPSYLGYSLHLRKIPQGWKVDYFGKVGIIG